MLIDAHCHLDHLSEEQISLFLATLSEKKLEAIIASGAKPADWNFYKTLSENFSQVKVCYGIHPSEITEHWEKDLDLLEKYLPHAVALGEIGLDFHGIFSQENVGTIKLQMKLFERQIRLAKKYNLPIVIHCREAFSVVKEILLYTKFDLKRVMFHCFVENKEAAEWIISNGGYVSYSGILTFKKPGATVETATIAPLSQIFIETDAPYLAPIPFRGKTNSPEYVRYVTEKLAEIKNVSIEEIIAQTTKNVHQFFRF